MPWRKQRTPRRGGPPDLEQVVKVAIDLADAEDLTAVSMRRVATALKSGTASLYRILDSREELLDRMVDTALGESLPPEPTGDWRADLAQFAQARRALLLRHPWLGSELAGRPALGPHALAHHERALAAVATLTEDQTAADSAVETILAYVLGAVARELAETNTRLRSGLTEEQWRTTVGPYIEDVLRTGDYPRLSRAIHEATDLDDDVRFERGLAYILNGLKGLAD